MSLERWIGSSRRERRSTARRAGEVLLDLGEDYPISSLGKAAYMARLQNTGRCRPVGRAVSRIGGRLLRQRLRRGGLVLARKDGEAAMAPLQDTDRLPSSEKERRVQEIRCISCRFA